MAEKDKAKAAKAAKAKAQKEARQIHDLVNSGFTRREANHLLRDGLLSAGKFSEARRQGQAKVSARKAAKDAKVGRVPGERGSARKSWWGTNKNSREWGPH